MKNILVLGATSAIAQSCARSWAGDDVKLHLVGRSEEKLSQVARDLQVRGAKVSIDVADLGDYDTQKSVIDGAIELMGRIDVVLLAYGSLPEQSECEQDAQLAVREFSNNGLSVIALLTELANQLEMLGSGCIAVISSVAGDRGRASNYVYGSAKAAVTTFCDGLRGRLQKSGVHVLVVKPGFVATPMTQDLDLPQRLLADPDDVAENIVRAVARRKNTLYTPWYWRYVMLIIKSIPETLFKRLKL